MNFIRKSLGLDADQKGAFTWTAIAVSAIIVIVVFVYGVIGSFGVGASWNAIARASRWAGPFWKIGGAVVLAAMVWFDVKAFGDRLNRPKIDGVPAAIIILAFIALLILVNIGFRFDHF